MAVLFAVAAFDDITTDTDTSFAFEWTGLAVCAAWLLVVSWRLVRSEHRWLGAVSVMVLAIAVVAGSTVRQGIGASWIGYLVTLGGLVWFLALSGMLATLAWRVRQHHAA